MIQRWSRTTRVRTSRMTDLEKLSCLCLSFRTGQTFEVEGDQKSLGGYGHVIDFGIWVNPDGIFISVEDWSRYLVILVSSKKLHYL